MSRFLKLFVPSLGGTAVVLAFAYIFADQFVADVPAPLRGRAVAPASAEAPLVVPVRADGADPAPLALGRPATPDEVAAWNIDVRPDGQGLPVGSGDVLTGEVLYTERCAVCHGVFGEAEGRWPVLAGGQGSLTNARPVKTIGSYWPYLSTVFDYVHRAMPFGEAQSLTADETYAIVAQLLYLNDLVDEDFILSNENFTDIRLPNEANFLDDDRSAPDGELAAFTRKVCMSGCKEDVRIIGRAAVMDVTPEDAAARKRLETAASAADDTASEPAPADVPDAPANAAEDTGADLIAAGEAAFRKCKTCHQVGAGAKNRSGPMLNDLFGRAAGMLDGFRYSGAMQKKGAEGLVWTPETLTEFLQDPRGYIKGTRMSFAGFDDAADTEAVIAYLKTFAD